MMNYNNCVINIEELLERAHSPVTNECCIYRVPFSIRKVNEDAYTPVLVSIGPLHHNRHPHLHNMEKIKHKFCKSFLAKTKTSTESWIHHIKEIEPKVRRCYSDTLHFTQEELLQLIFLDSVFILHLFLSVYYSDWSEEDDSLFFTPWMRNNIRRDLLLLENQLPFFVLELLFNLSFSSRSQNGISFLQLTFHYFRKSNKSKLNFDNINKRHFTDLLRTFNLQHPPDRLPPRDNGSLRHLPTATELSRAGVRFEVNTASHCLLDFTFTRGVFQIPLLVVEDMTEVFFRNMIALEQCHYPRESYIMDYILVLDLLVNTSRDVDILLRQKVIENWLGDTDSVANMFNGLLKNTIFKNFNSHYLKLGRDVNAFYSNRWSNLKSTLRRDYCNNPWQTAASIAAMLLLFLTLVQTVCSVWQTIKQ